MTRRTRVVSQKRRDSSDFEAASSDDEDNIRTKKNTTADSSDEEYRDVKPRVKRRKTATTNTKKGTSLKNQTTNTKKTEQQIAFEEWAKQQNEHFSSIDNQKLVDDSESFYQYTSDNEHADATTEHKNEKTVTIAGSSQTSNSSSGGGGLFDNSPQPDNIHRRLDMSVEDVIYSSLSDSQHLDLSFELSSTSAAPVSTPKTSDDSVAMTPAELQLKQRYPTLYTEYLEYRRAILGIVEPLSFSDFVEQNGIGI